jgi:formiminotetrahydrofolate cyclodeaminase
VYIKKELREYLNELASFNAVPGGGSASALAAALGVALSTMVANFTLRNKRYKSVNSRIKMLQRKNESIRRKLEALIDKDVIVFLKLRNIISMSKEKKQRDALLEKSFKDAANVPYEICLLVSEAVKICSQISEIGNKNLISDMGASAYLLEAAYNCACLNIKINLKYIRDKKFIKKKNRDLKKIEEKIYKCRKNAVKKVKGYL